LFFALAVLFLALVVAGIVSGDLGDIGFNGRTL
jgi:hypothetical protein